MKTWINTALFLLGLCALPAMAQQGHPLSGTWQGDWGEQGGTAHFLTLIMEWDGSRITGIANPGPDSTAIDTMTLDASDWSVRIDMDIKDSAGNTVRFQGEGRLGNLGSQTRTLEGTWRGNGRSGRFSLTRQSGA